MSSTRTVSVTLPGEIIYVSGTVNGVDKTWTLVDGSWQTVAERAADDIYTVSLTAVNAAGTGSDFELTLYYGVLNLITDRTRADVERWRYLRGKGWAGMTEAEQAEWLAGLKGAYNASDFNRVTAAMECLTDKLEHHGYAVAYAPVEAGVGRTEWLMTDIPTTEQKRGYLANVAALRAVLALPERTPEVPPDMDELTETEANDIEQILVDLDTMIGNMTQAWYFSGELYAGEV